MAVTTRTLGRSGIGVSALGMGCWAIGGPWAEGSRPLGWGAVDDDESVRTLFRRALEEDGWTVTEAENGVVALERAAERRPDLVLLDLMMPMMDGFEFVVKFRAREENVSIPIIVVTAKDLTREDHQRLAGGVERIIQKGALTRQELLAQVRDQVARYHLPAGEENDIAERDDTAGSDEVDDNDNSESA